MLGFALRKPWLRALICASCLYHLAAMISANLAFNSAFGSELRQPFAHYIGYLGLWQNWSMFHTIPQFRAIHPKLVAGYADGSEKVYAPMLPGLAPYEHHTRLGSLFFRYIWPTSDIEPYAREYMKRACREIAKRSGQQPKSVTLRLDSLRLRTLFEVRFTHQTAKPAIDKSPIVVSCS